VDREPKLPSPHPDLGPPPKGAGGPVHGDLTPRGLRPSGEPMPEDWVPAIALDALPEGAPPGAILVDFLADNGVDSAILEGSGQYRGIPTPPRLFVHPRDVDRALSLIARAACEASRTEPAGGAQAEHEIEELREHDWRSVAGLTPVAGIIIGLVVIGMALILLRGCVFGG
jgi:hypothetical protein